MSCNGKVEAGYSPKILMGKGETEPDDLLRAPLGRLVAKKPARGGTLGYGIARDIHLRGGVSDNERSAGF